MATYEDIQKANECIKTTTIEKKNTKTGKVTAKEYAEVNQRIKAFRMVYPDGFIKTYLKSNENGVCVFQAECGYAEVNEDYCANIILGVGHAYEKESSSFINKTSYIENCETSAVGRALGMAGFGIDTSVASMEEVETAIHQQEMDKPISKAHIEALKTVADEKGVAYKDILDRFHIDRFEQMTEAEYGSCLNMLAKTEKKNV